MHQRPARTIAATHSCGIDDDHRATPIVGESGWTSPQQRHRLLNSPFPSLRLEGCQETAPFKERTPATLSRSRSIPGMLFPRFPLARRSHWSLCQPGRCPCPQPGPPTRAKQPGEATGRRRPGKRTCAICQTNGRWEPGTCVPPEPPCNLGNLRATHARQGTRWPTLPVIIGPGTPTKGQPDSIIGVRIGNDRHVSTSQSARSPDHGGARRGT